LKKIDALGGYFRCFYLIGPLIRLKMLNKSKGHPMWSPRVQSDRMRFVEEWRMMLEGTPNLIYQESEGLVIEKELSKEFNF
jgi:tRNA uridine 5-carboxymethylaminomethyl modification enzyme